MKARPDRDQADPDWLAARRPTRPVSRRPLGQGLDVAVEALTFEPWSGPPLGMAEDCNKRGGRIVGDAGELGCAEVEIGKRLRRAAWDAAWVSAFKCGERRWRPYRSMAMALPDEVRDLEGRLGLGWRPDVVAWTQDRILS